MTLATLTEQLHNLSQKGNDGELILSNRNFALTLHIYRGKLLYATNSIHPVRRWTRALQRHCSTWKWGVESSYLLDNQFRECGLLERGISQQQLSLIRAKLVIRNVVQECFFELSSHTSLNSEWKPSQKEISISCQTAALSSQEVRSVLYRTTQMQQQWQAAGLAHLSPILAPTIKGGTESQGLPILGKYLNGDLTIWDIALHLEKSVTEVTRSLLPLVETNSLEFKEIPDLPVTTAEQPVVETHRLPEVQPLIACIDDSPVLAHTLKKILVPAGYQMLSIPEPMRGFTQLIENKPDLILLDLLLPNANGYSICKFLRDTPAFEKTPIIILTAKNTLVDRARARMAGATEFLGKPPEARELLQMLQRYLGQ